MTTRIFQIAGKTYNANQVGQLLTNNVTALIDAYVDAYAEAIVEETSKIINEIEKNSLDARRTVGRAPSNRDLRVSVATGSVKIRLGKYTGRHKDISQIRVIDANKADNDNEDFNAFNWLDTGRKPVVTTTDIVFPGYTGSIIGVGSNRSAIKSGNKQYTNTLARVGRGRTLAAVAPRNLWERIRFAVSTRLSQNPPNVRTPTGVVPFAAKNITISILQVESD